MEATSPGPSIPLIQKKKKRNTNLCIICQKIYDRNKDKKLTSTTEGRTVIIEKSKILKDDLLIDLSENEYLCIKYHLRTCYAGYRLRKAVAKSPEKPSQTDEGDISSISSPKRHKRRKIVKTDPKDKPCIICDQIKFKGTSERHRIEDFKRAVNFLNAFNFNKDIVHTRCILCKTAKDIFAADIMYHKSCMESYLLKFRRDIEVIVQFQDDEDITDSVELKATFKDVIASLDLDTSGYALSDIREMLEKRLQSVGVGKHKTSKFLLSRVLIVRGAISNFPTHFNLSYPP